MRDTIVMDGASGTFLVETGYEAESEALDDTYVLDSDRLKDTGYLVRRAIIRGEIARVYWWMAIGLYGVVIAFTIASL